MDATRLSGSLAEMQPQRSQRRGEAEKIRHGFIPMHTDGGETPRKEIRTQAEPQIAQMDADSIARYYNVAVFRAGALGGAEVVAAASAQAGGPGGEATLTLQFDRAINIAAFSGPAIAVADGLINNGLYQGQSASLIGPSTVEIILEWVGSYFESDQHMSATPTTGIVAVNHAGTWAGVTDLPLPFP